MVVNWIGTIVPGFRHVLSELNSRNCFKLGVLLMGEQLSMIHTQMGVVIWMNVCVTV